MFVYAVGKPQTNTFIAAITVHVLLVYGLTIDAFAHVFSYEPVRAYLVSTNK